MAHEEDRTVNTSTNLPIAYGSIAFFLGPQADEYHTHRWTLYVRSPNSDFDLSVAISRVVFQLHPSFAQPVRELTEPPFEVTERGWGEFEASLKIVWKEGSGERNTVLTHGIKLYPSNTPPTSPDPTAFMNTTVPVVSEKFDEVVFTNPKKKFHKELLEGTRRPPSPPPFTTSSTSKLSTKNSKERESREEKTIKENSTKTEKSSSMASLPKFTCPLSKEPAVIQHFRTYGDEHEVQAMLEAKKFLDGELREIKDRLLRADEELEELREEIRLVLAKIDGGGVVGGIGGNARDVGLVGGKNVAGGVAGVVMSASAVTGTGGIRGAGAAVAATAPGSGEVLAAKASITGQLVEVVGGDVGVTALGSKAFSSGKRSSVTGGGSKRKLKPKKSDGGGQGGNQPAGKKTKITHVNV